MLLKIWSMLLLQHYGKPEYLVCQLNNGTSCPKAICPDTTLNFICNIAAQQLGYTKWLLPNGTCTNSDEKITLLQPKYGGCNPSSSSQHGTCGPFTAQNVANSGCVNSSLSAVATLGLNGTEIRCMNYNGSSLFLIGNATISIAAPPHTPNMSVVPSCTQIAVQWSVSSMPLGEPTTVIVSAKTGTIVSQTNSISTTMSTSSVTFNNLVSDSLYTITVEGSNCAGRSSATIDMWTLPSPPQNIHAYHVISTPSTVHLQVTWTPVVGNNKLTYTMRVSSKDDLILNQVPVSSDHCDTTTCQFTIDFNATDTSVFFISIATISDSRIGPHSDEVKSVLGEKPSVDSADVPDARVKALYSSLYNTSKQQHIESASNALVGDQHSDAMSEREIEQCTSPYSYVRTKKVKVVTLPDSQNGYSTVPKEGSSLPCAETSPLAGLCDDSVKAAEVVMSS
ncbi:hypothetical protein EMCRGX_G015483 [Ephydatia muelleri]